MKDTSTDYMDDPLSLAEESASAADSTSRKLAPVFTYHATLHNPYFSSEDVSD
jgi:hypothetical protein